MKKSVEAIGIICLLMTAGFLGFLIFESEVASAGTTRYVGGTGGGNYTTIQDAINESNDGDTVYVYNGTYFENVVVNRSINLTGEDRIITIINGIGSGDIVKITADWVNVTGFTITNGSRGVYISSDFVTISNTNITSIQGENGVSGPTGENGHVSAGIYLNSSFGTNISNNKIFDIDGGNGGNSNNDFKTGGAGSLVAGIYLQYSANNNIINNTINTINGGNGGTGGLLGSGGAGGVGSGIILQTSETNAIINNTIKTINGGTGGPGGTGGSDGIGGTGAGIYLQTSMNNTIISNILDTIDGGAGGPGEASSSGGTGGIGTGIYLQISTNNTIKNNTINTINGGIGGTGGDFGSDGASQIGFGIFIDNNSLNNIIDSTNTMDGDEILYYYNQNGITIENYCLKFNSNPTNYGKIVLINCNDFTIKNNEIANFTGISGGTGGYHGSGDIGGFGSGIHLQTSINNAIINNTLNTIIGGIGGTGGHGGSGGAGGISTSIYLQTSTNNTIINNTLNTIDGGIGGTGGYLGSGGTGGIGAGLYLQTSTNNIIINNNIKTINGGTGGNGDNFGSTGASQVGFGIFIDSNSFYNIIEPTNTMDGNEILYYYNQKGTTIENYSLKSNSNPTNYGKIVLINCNDFTIKNNEIVDFTGISGETGDREDSGDVGGIGAGIYLHTSMNNTIINNTVNIINSGTGGSGGFRGSGGAGGISAGLYLQTSSNNTIINNILNTIIGGKGGTGTYDGSGGAGGIGAGIYIQTSTNNNVINNNITTINGGTGGTGGADGGSGGASQVGFGIFIDGNSLNNIIEPTNTLDGDKILYCYNQSAITIENYSLKANSNPTNYGKIVLINCNDFTIKNNEIANFTGISGETGEWMDPGGAGGFGAGIYLQTSTNNTIMNNTINIVNGGTGGTGGMDGAGGMGGVGAGLYLQTSSNNTIINNTLNTIIGGTGGTGGAASSGGTGGTGAGIYLQISTNNFIMNHNCSNNNHGIYFYSSSGNIIENNTFSNNDYGITLYSSSNNRIYHNNFIDNVNQASDDMSDNFWNDTYPSGGNYWSDFDELSEGAYDDYQGQNQDIVGSDGIVDNGSAGVGMNPYVIDANSQDNYPLMEPIDRIPPTISGVTAIPDPQKIGENVNISADITDNCQHFGVWIEIYDPDINFVGFFSMLYDSVNGRYYWNQISDILGTYTFTIRANDTSDNWGSASGFFSSATIPGAPTALAVRAGKSYVNITWNAPVLDGGSPVTNYRVYKDETSGGETFLAEIGNIFYYNDTDVYNSKPYYYKVSAVNIIGESPLSNEASGMPVSVPSEPTDLIAIVGDSYVNLTWNAPSSVGVSAIIRYNIYRKDSGGVYDTVSADQLWYVDTNVINGITYTYNVSAINSVGEGLNSTVSVKPVTTPSAPQNLQVNAGNSYVNLTWNEPSDNGGSPLTNHTIYRGTTSDGEKLLIEIGNVRFYNDTNVTNGVKYYYKVGGKNAVGEGPLSNEVNVNPSEPPNQLPTCNISSPKPGARISNTIEINGTAYDSDGTVQHVEIKINDGNWIWVSGTTYWSYNLDTTGLINGQHTIYVRSYDGTNYSSETIVSVAVDNPQDEKPEELWWLWLLIALIIILLVIVALLVLRMKKPVEEEVEEEPVEEEEIPPPPPKKAMITELFEEGEEEVPSPPDKATIEDLSEEKEVEREVEEELPPSPQKAKRYKELSEKEMDRLDLPEPDEEF